MRLITYGAGESERGGVLVNSKVYPLANGWIGGEPPKTMRKPLAAHDWRQRAAEAPDRLAGSSAPRSFDLGEVDLRAPMPEPSNRLATGSVKETASRPGGAAPPVTLCNVLAPSAVIGPFDQIIRPDGVTQIDYEVQLAIVIGALAEPVAREDTLDYVAGFTVANDAGSRDLQFSAGKGPRFCNDAYSRSCDISIGPAVVTIEEFPEIDKLNLTTQVNGNVRQYADASDYIFSVGDLVEALSRVLTLKPREIILMESPAGVGAYRNPPE